MIHTAPRTSVDVTTKQLSLQILKNTVSLGVSSVLFLRNLFPESAFSNVWFEGLQLVQLKPTDKKAALIISLLRTGVNDALQKECLKQLQLGIHERETDALLESYEFSFGYAGRQVGISVARKEGDEITTNEISGRKPVSKVEARKQTEATPLDYSPKGFASKIENEHFGGQVPFTAIGDTIDTSFHTLKISIQSLKDPPMIMPLMRPAEGNAAPSAPTDHPRNSGQQPAAKALPAPEHSASRAPPSIAPPQRTTSNLLRSPKTANERLNDYRREAARTAGRVYGPLPSGVRQWPAPEIMETARQLLNQCEELATKKRIVDVPTVASFCAVSDVIAKELLRKMLDAQLRLQHPLNVSVQQFAQQEKEQRMQAQKQKKEQQKKEQQEKEQQKKEQQRKEQQEKEQQRKEQQEKEQQEKEQQEKEQQKKEQQKKEQQRREQQEKEQQEKEQQKKAQQKKEQPTSRVPETTRRMATRATARVSSVQGVVDRPRVKRQREEPSRSSNRLASAVEVIDVDNTKQEIVNTTGPRRSHRIRPVTAAPEPVHTNNAAATLPASQRKRSRK
ncbi:hypothetical protein Emed_007520 [Eimeria media]